MLLYNTLVRKKEEFVPLKKGAISFYQCGPTVYWTQHIGNLRAMTMGDVIRRTLEYLDYSVTHARNYTDVGHLVSDEDEGEDKMEKGAKREGKTPDEIAKKYIDIFEQDTRALNILEPTHKPRATAYVQQMIDMVSVLMEKGFAYKTDLAVYYDVSKFDGYTKLSGQKLEKNVKGAGHADVEDSEKRNSQDFALWFFLKGEHKNAMQHWSSPWGEGFPGWHIECSAMSKALLGDTIDIHMGGVEHIPVHHTNEIAQSEASNGVKFVNYWLHNEHLLVNNEKMAKSQGTGYSLEEVKAKGFHPLVLRYFFLQAHYRSQQNFTWEGLEASHNGLENLLKTIFILRESLRRSSSDLLVAPHDSLWRKKFVSFLEDDFNLPAALAVLWELLNSKEPAETKMVIVFDFDKVLGLNLDKLTAISIPTPIKQLIGVREQLRQEKKFQEADKVRTQIEDQGFTLEDANGKTVVMPKRFLGNG
ncbi:MAG: cysteine--tRNA ligase [Patescibacteria group bacterium]|jgi:cysteinyl-tRNA synthetase